MKRLYEVIVPAALEPLHTVGDAVARGEKQHRRTDALAAHLPHRLESVQTRHHDVHDHRVVFGGAGVFQRLLAVKAGVDAVALVLQRFADDLVEALFILCYQ